MVVVEHDIKEFLSHHGVRGMRWGQRKGPQAGAPKQSRKERRAAAKQARFAENQKKANMFLKTALKDPNVLIRLNGQIVVTGKEFTQHLSNGGLLNVKTTSIYAQQKNKSGPYVLQ